MNRVQNNLVSVLDTVINGSDANYESVMKHHRCHYAQFYNIYKMLGREVEDAIEYADVNTTLATFKINEIELDRVQSACDEAQIYDPSKDVKINVYKDGTGVSVNISIK